MAYHRQQGVDTCIVRIFNTYGQPHAAARRPRDPDVRAPGARAEAADRLRRRLADAELLLRRRPRPRPDRARRERRAPAGQHRQPAGVHAARARREGDRDLRRRPDRLRGAADRRPEGAPAGHHPRPADPRLGARDRARRGPAAPATRRSRGRRPLSRRLLGPGGRARRDRRPLRAGRERVALHRARHLRRRADPLRQPRRRLPDAEAAALGAPAHQPPVGWPERRRAAPAGAADRSGGSGLQLGGVRPDGQLRAAVRA